MHCNQCRMCQKQCGVHRSQDVRETMQTVHSLGYAESRCDRVLCAIYVACADYMRRPRCARNNVKCANATIGLKLCKICGGYNMQVCEEQRACSSQHKTWQLAYNYVKTSTIKLCKEIVEMKMHRGNTECNEPRMCTRQCKLCTD
jgi:hypothetical protein